MWQEIAHHVPSPWIDFLEITGRLLRAVTSRYFSLLSTFLSSCAILVVYIVTPLTQYLTELLAQVINAMTSAVYASMTVNGRRPSSNLTLPCSDPMLARSHTSSRVTDALLAFS